MTGTTQHRKERIYEHLLRLYGRPFMNKTRLMFLQGCTNDGSHVACDNYIPPPVASNICGSSVWDLQRITFLASIIFRWLPDFLQICAPLF